MGVIAVADVNGQGLGVIQRGLASWNNATCVNVADSTESAASIKVSLKQPVRSTLTVKEGLANVAAAAATCSVTQVAHGDSCPKLASECGISPADFTEYNPEPNECSTLIAGEWVCCSAGALPDYSPKPYVTGTCYTYTVHSGDTCSALAAANSMTLDDLDNYNKETWGWTGCNPLPLDVSICLSTGDPPMPAPVSNAECGPLIPGTAYPTNGTALSDLNQCPLNACCDIWVRSSSAISISIFFIIIIIFFSMSICSKLKSHRAFVALQTNSVRNPTQPRGHLVLPPLARMAVSPTAALTLSITTLAVISHDSWLL